MIFSFGYEYDQKLCKINKSVYFLFCSAGEVYFCSHVFTEGDTIRLYDENGTIAEAPPSARKLYHQLVKIQLWLLAVA